jgi:hypothetical protein
MSYVRVTGDINAGEDIDNYIKSQTRLGMMKVAFSIKDELEKQSPVGETGHFKESWKLSTVSDTKIEITNTAPYSPAIEFGSMPGHPPWPSAGRRTVRSAGRVWSSQAVGGMSRVITDSFLDNLIDKYIKI